MNPLAIIAYQTKDYPRLPDGRIDYTGQPICFVFNCVVCYGDEILLVRRSQQEVEQPRMLNGVSGFIDRTDTSITVLAGQELAEELGIDPRDTTIMVAQQPLMQIDAAHSRQWYVYPVLVECAQRITPRLNAENSAAAWYPLTAIDALPLLPFYHETLRAGLAMRHK